MLLTFTGWIAKAAQNVWREWTEEVEFLSPQTILKTLRTDDPQERMETAFEEFPESKEQRKARNALSQSWLRA